MGYKDSHMINHKTPNGHAYSLCETILFFWFVCNPRLNHVPYIDRYFNSNSISFWSSTTYIKQNDGYNCLYFLKTDFYYCFRIIWDFIFSFNIIFLLCPYIVTLFHSLFLLIHSTTLLILQLFHLLFLICFQRLFLPCCFISFLFINFVFLSSFLFFLSLFLSFPLTFSPPFSSISFLSFFK